MKQMSKTIAFFGSGPVAAASLRLLSQEFSIEAVITKPRAEHHKGSVPVLEVAAELGLPVFTVTNKRTLNELFATRPLQSSLAVLIDFGIIVDQQVIDYFPLGIINSHFSLLPEWRGADPITFSILSGQKETGVSLMVLTAGMDEGPLLAYAPFTLPAAITTPELTEALIALSFEQLKIVLPLYIEDAVQPQPQNPAQNPTYSRKLSKEDSILDWSKPAIQLEREIRAFIEWPKSRTTFGSLEIIITKARVANDSGQPGVRTIINKEPAIFCKEGALVIEQLKPAGKKEMTGEAFLAGYKQIFLA